MKEGKVPYEKEGGGGDTYNYEVEDGFWESDCLLDLEERTRPLRRYFCSSTTGGWTVLALDCNLQHN